MDESDFEIEYLDEDEDLVQHCIDTIQEAPPPTAITIIPPKIYGGETRIVSPKPLLVERICLQNDSDDEKPAPRRNRRSVKEEDDSDYDPGQDNSEDEPIVDGFERPSRQRRYKRQVKNAATVSYPTKTLTKIPKTVSNNEQSRKKMALKNEPMSLRDNGPMALKHSHFIKKYKDKVNKKELPETGISVTSSEITPNITETIIKMGTKPQTGFRNKPPHIYSTVDSEPFKIFPPDCEEVRLFDYGDPKHFTSAKLLTDKETLKKWNNICRQQSKKYKALHKNVKSSKITQFLQNVKMFKNGKVESVLKMHVEVRTDDKVDSFQATLPKFELDTPKIEIKFRPRIKGSIGSSTKKLETVTLLSTETTKDERMLVAYSPTDRRSTTFKMVETGKSDEGSPRYIRMVMSCKMCAKCYQYSWRGNKEDKRAKAKAECSVCGSHFTSAYNLLSHVRSHDASAVRKSKKLQAKVLSKIVGYHFKCRICGFQANSVKSLRSHLDTHGGQQKFRCEVGQHMAT